MKKILKISFIVLILMTILYSVQNVYAASSCNMTIQTDKDEYSTKDEIIVYARLSNVETTKGIVSINMTLDYDKEGLNLLKVEGQNGWETPVDQVTYNSENGKIVITKNGLAKSDENVLKMTFSLKESNMQTVRVGLKEITLSDSTLIKTDDVYKDISIKKEQEPSKPTQNDTTQNNTTQDNPTQNNTTQNNATQNNTAQNNTTQNNAVQNNTIQNNTTQNSSISNNKNVVDNSVSNSDLPKTGTTNWLPIIFIIILGIDLVLFYIRRKNRKE